MRPVSDSKRHKESERGKHSTGEEQTIRFQKAAEVGGMWGHDVGLNLRVTVLPTLCIKETNNAI
jgi:hypothetical protein